MRQLITVQRLAIPAASLLLSIGVDLTAQIPLQETLYVASNGAAGDSFGGRVATADDITVVQQIDWPNRATEVGSVYVLDGCNQAQEVQLQGSNLVPSDMFAMSVATDGNLIVVGAPQTDSVSQSGTGGPGKAYVFRRTPTGWVEEATLVPAGGGPDDAFGWSVDVDDDLIAVGAPGKNTFGGVVHLFRFDGTQWSEETRVAESTNTYRYSGLNVALSGDTVVTGNHTTAPFWASSARVGSAIACRKTSSGWRQFALLAPNGTFFGQFGLGLAAADDRIAIGAPGRAGQNTPGEAYVFDWNGNGFSLVGTLTASDGVADDSFGRGLAISDELVAVGADKHDNDKGAVYLYRFDGTNWAEQKIMASDATSGDRLGLDLDFYSGRLAAAAVGNDDLGTDSGSIYFFSTPLFRSYGQGLAGTGGIVPTLTGRGQTQPGSLLTLEGRDFLGGAPTILYVGLDRAAVPQFGGTLLVDLMPSAQAVLPLQGVMGMAGDGASDIRVRVPAALSCQSVFFQQWALDPAAPGFVSMSNGLEVYLVD